MNLSHRDVQPHVPLPAVRVGEAGCARDEDFTINDLVAGVRMDLADATGGGQLANVRARRGHLDLADVQVDADVAEGAIEVYLAEPRLDVDVGAGRYVDGHLEHRLVACTPSVGVSAEAAADDGLVALDDHFRRDVVDDALVLLAPGVTVELAPHVAMKAESVARAIADPELARRGVEHHPAHATQRRRRVA